MLPDENTELQNDTAEFSLPGEEVQEPTSDATEGLEATVTALQATLSEEREKREAAEKSVLYIQADFQNYRRRKEEEFLSQQKYNNAETIKAILPILDNFERALQAAEQHQSYDKLIGGVNGTMKQLQALLQKLGVTSIETVGKEFDPQFHEAIGAAEESSLPVNTVAEEVQRGYMMHDRVLRPALVKVVQG